MQGLAICPPTKSQSRKALKPNRLKGLEFLGVMVSGRNIESEI